MASILLLCTLHCFSWPFQVVAHIKTAFSHSGTAGSSSGHAALPVRRTVVTRVLEAVQALALCHNVTPVYEDGSEDAALQAEADQQSQQTVVYQASSPDEVNWTWLNMSLFCLSTQICIKESVFYSKNKV